MEASQPWHPGMPRDARDAPVPRHELNHHVFHLFFWTFPWRGRNLLVRPATTANHCPPKLVGWGYLNCWMVHGKYHRSKWMRTGGTPMTQETTISLRDELNESDSYHIGSFDTLHHLRSLKMVVQARSHGWAFHFGAVGAWLAKMVHWIGSVHPSVACF